MSVFLVAGLVVMASLVRAQEQEQSEKEAMYYRYLEFSSYVKGGSIEPHWMADGSSFWYAEGAPANTVIYKVDPRANAKTSLFDTARLRQALTPVLGHEPPYDGLPFQMFTFIDESETQVKFSVENDEYVLELETYTVTRVPPPSEAEKRRTTPQVVRDTPYFTSLYEELSPDCRWFAHLKDYNLWLRSTTDGRLVQLTTDGVKDHAWVEEEMDSPKWAWWSPDSMKLAVWKEDNSNVAQMPVVHWLKPVEEVEWVRVRRTGQPFPKTELFIIDIVSKRLVRVNIGDTTNHYTYILGWQADGSEVLFLKINRENNKMDLMAGNPFTGAARVVLSVSEETFFPKLPWRAHEDFSFLEDGKRFILISERDGWRHLYLYNLDDILIRRLTQGAFPVVKVVAVDEKASWVYFTAHADRQRPYDTHLYRVSLQGEGFMQLTEATGSHGSIHFAPSKEFFLDSHSSLDRAHRVELRRADGTLLQTLAQANIDALKELKWKPPEEFVVKAADGETDLYGVLYKPYDFDPGKKYPVIEYIYAGPQRRVVPHTFIYSSAAWAQLGFIVFIVDGRGTPERGKAFQDVVYRNIGRYEIPDHVATLRQLAEERPYMDLSRVGVFGHSWGGHFAIRALLQAPEVYHVGIALAPDVDFYTHGVWDLEPYMGLPQDNKEGYDYGSNLWLAGNLKGKLLLIHGTSDVSVPFAVTMKMVEALIRAGKPYDLIVLPEQSHGLSGTSLTYSREAVRRYFQEHLKP